MRTAAAARAMLPVLCGLLGWFLAALSCRAGETNQARSLVLVIGAPGEASYAASFQAAAGRWKAAAQTGGFRVRVVGEDADRPEDDLQRLTAVLGEEVARPDGELWLVFLGHGTYDGRSAKFNLRGPDLTATNLATLLKPCRRPLVVIQCASASGAFLPPLSAPGRVIVTATRSGNELNATRFGDYLAAELTDPAADLDRDGQTSLLEACLAAARKVGEFYQEQGRVLTEHMLVDDNGDGLGTPAAWFHGVRAIKPAAGGKAVDGLRANQIFLVPGAAERQLSTPLRARRDQLEDQLAALRLRKAALAEAEYYQKIEAILSEIARLYETKP